jgi:hypothetical protein
MSLTRSLITDQHRPILGQPPANRFATGTAPQQAGLQRAHQWITGFCNNLASASVVLGMLTPVLTNTVTYWFSVPISTLVASAFGGFSMWLLV